MNFDNYLGSLMGNTSNFDATEKSYDATGSYLTPEEYYEAVQIENYLTQGKRLAPNQARRISERIVKDTTGKALIKEEMRKAGLSAGFNPAMPTFVGNLQAQVNFQIKRLTANIAGVDLPVPLFGAYDAASKYNQVLTMPAGTSITAFDMGVIGNETKLRITYTKGANSDIVEITLQEYAYPSFIEALKGTSFNISNGRYSISDTTATGLQQMSKKLRALKYSMFGNQNADNIPLSASKSPFQQQNGIVDILGNFNVDAQITWVLDVQPLANQEITIAAFITAVNKAA